MCNDGVMYLYIIIFALPLINHANVFVLFSLVCVAPNDKPINFHSKHNTQIGMIFSNVTTANVAPAATAVAVRAILKFSFWLNVNVRSFDQLNF